MSAIRRFICSGIREAVDAVAERPPRSQPLYTHRFRSNVSGKRSTPRAIGRRVPQSAGDFPVTHDDRMRRPRPALVAPRVSRGGLDRPPPDGRHLADGRGRGAALADPSPKWPRAPLRWRRRRSSSRHWTIFWISVVDGIVIATPSAAHAEQTIRALRRGAAVFCQKPLGRSAAEVRSVVDGRTHGRPASRRRPLVPLHGRHAPLARP